MNDTTFETILDERSVAQAIEEAFPFTVDKFPLFGPEQMRTPHYGLFRSDSGDCIGTACSAKYLPHTLEDVTALATAAAGAFSGDAQVKATWHDGHCVSIVPSDEHRRSVFGTRDNIFPRLIIRASYDGRAFSATLGYYRDVCRNLAILRSAGFSAGDSIKHTHGLTERVDDLRTMFRRLASGWDRMAETAAQMEQEQIDLAAFIRNVYPVAETASRKTKRSADRRTEKIIRRVVRERMATGRDDLRISEGTYHVSAWEAYNAVQGYIQHDQVRRGRLDDFGRALVALRDPAVSRAMEFAVSA